MTQLKLIALFGLGLILSLTAMGQTVDYSSKQKLTDKSYYASPLGENSFGVYIVHQDYKQPNRRVELEHYHVSNYQLLNSIPLANTKDEYLLQVLLWEEKLSVIYSRFNPITKWDDFYIRTYSPQLKQIGKDTLVLSLPDNKLDPNQLRIEKKRTANTFLFIYPMADADGYYTGNLMVIALDSAYQTIQKSIIAPDIVGKYGIKNVDYSQNAYQLLLQYPSGYNDESQFKAVMGYFGTSNTQLFSYLSDTIQYLDMGIKYDKVNQEFIHYGLYRKKTDKFVKGAFMMSFNPYGKQTKILYHPLDYLRSNFSLYPIEFGIIHLTDFILRKDGGGIFICEEKNQSREIIPDYSVNGFSTNTYRYYYFYGNIGVFSINPDNRMDWFNILKKEQTTVNDNGIFSSYLLQTKNENIALYYNDLSRKRTALSAYILNYKGELSTKICIKPQDYKGKLILRDGNQVSKDALIIPLVKENQRMFVRVMD